MEALFLEKWPERRILILVFAKRSHVVVCPTIDVPSLSPKLVEIAIIVKTGSPRTSRGTIYLSFYLNSFTKQQRKTEL